MSWSSVACEAVPVLFSACCYYGTKTTAPAHHTTKTNVLPDYAARHPTFSSLFFIGAVHRPASSAQLHA